MKRSFSFVDLTAFAVLTLAACGGTDNGDGDGGGGGIIPSLPICGFVCPGDEVDGETLPGINEGNTSISGVQSVDAFFSAVLSFETAANGVSDGIQSQLDAIRGDFGIEGDLAAGLDAQLQANLAADLDIDFQPAQCAVDAQATLEASAKCDATVSGGKAEIECKGSCEAEVSADVSCDANAELRCTVTAPDIECSGECQGSCDVQLTAAASCEGTCKGSCDGECSGYVKNASGQLECNGTCSGKCSGHCEAQLEAAASCQGTCRGECTVTKPSGGCEGGIHAECRAKANASFMCSGRCTGEFEPPKVSAECEASAKAQASVNVQCTPPRLAVNFVLKPTVDAKFKAALSSLIDVRLPALLQAVGKGNLVANAGDSLGAAASGAFKGAVDATRKKAKLKTLNGLNCALEQLPRATTIVSDAADTLTEKLSDCEKLSAVLHMKS